MFKIDLDKITRNFNLILEGHTPDATSYAAVVLEILDALRPSSRRDRKYIDVAKQHMNEINKNIRKLNERIGILEEQVKVLEENKKSKE